MHAWTLIHIHTHTHTHTHTYFFLSLVLIMGVSIILSRCIDISMSTRIHSPNLFSHIHTHAHAHHVLGRPEFVHAHDDKQDQAADHATVCIDKLQDLELAGESEAVSPPRAAHRLNRSSEDSGVGCALWVFNLGN